jgi:hypothetical protein
MARLPRKNLLGSRVNGVCWTHVLRTDILLCHVGGHVSDKKQKQAERRAQREAYRRWKQHLSLTREQYHLLDQMNRGRRSVKTLRGGATGLRQQDRRRV